MNTTKARNTTVHYSYSSGVSPQKVGNQYGTGSNVIIRRLLDRFNRLSLLASLRANLHLAVLAFILMTPLLLISDSTQVFVLLMSNHVAGLLLGIIKYKVTG